MNAILIVDDSVTVRMDLAEALADAGFAAESAGSLGAARDRLARGGVGLLLLDVNLPDGNGVDLLREIRAAEASRALPVLLMSSEAEVRDRIRGLSHAADDYLGKPYSIDYVIQRCGELLREHAPQRILLIDDSPTFRGELRDFLTQRGHPVVSAGSAEEGLRLAARQVPRLVLVDRQLPGLSGDEFIRRLRLDPALRTVPCLMLTASDDRETELAALAAGADGYIRKSGSLDALAARVQGLLAAEPLPPVAADVARNRVLVVSKDEVWGDAISTALRSDARDVARARSADEALDLLPLQRVDAVVVDAPTLGAPALELCRRMKAHPGWKQVPVMVLTGAADAAGDPALHALAAGANDTAPRDAGLDVLQARLRALERRKRYEDEARSVQALRREAEASARAEALARHQAGHDSLTGLPNRLLFMDQLQGAIQRAERQRTSCALLYIDMDGFKPVNDTHGHAAGDALLRAFAQRLLEALRKEDRAARLGGDEFAVLLEQPIGADEALRKAEALVAAAGRPYRIDLGGAALEVSVGCSVGLALYPDHAGTLEALVHAADGAMYRAKRAGKGLPAGAKGPGLVASAAGASGKPAS